MRRRRMLSLMTLVYLLMPFQASGEDKLQKTDRVLTRSQIIELLDTPCPEVNVESETSVADVLSQFMTGLRKKTGVDLGVLEDKQEFDLEGISSLEDVPVAPIRIPENAQTCHDALRSIFRYAAENEPELSYAISSGLLLITTRARAESDDSLFTKIYDVSEFLIVESDVPADLRDRIADDRGVSALVGMIDAATGPPSRWQTAHGEGGCISVYGQYVIVRQTLQGHRQLDAFFAMLREAIQKGGTPIVLKSQTEQATSDVAQSESASSAPGADGKKKRGLVSGGGYF